MSEIMRSKKCHHSSGHVGECHDVPYTRHAAYVRHSVIWAHPNAYLQWFTETETVYQCTNSQETHFSWQVVFFIFFFFFFLQFCCFSNNIMYCWHQIQVCVTRSCRLLQLLFCEKLCFHITKLHTWPSSTNKSFDEMHAYGSVQLRQRTSVLCE